MKKKQDKDTEFMTIAEVASYTNLSQQTVAAYIHGQGLPALQIKPGGAWRISRTALNAWLQDHIKSGDSYLFPQGFPKGAN